MKSHLRAELKERYLDRRDVMASIVFALVLTGGAWVATEGKAMEGEIDRQIASLEAKQCLIP